jgi:hypothetical protein
MLTTARSDCGCARSAYPAACRKTTWAKGWASRSSRFRNTKTARTVSAPGACSASPRFSRCRSRRCSAPAARGQGRRRPLRRAAHPGRGATARSLWPHRRPHDPPRVPALCRASGGDRAAIRPPLVTGSRSIVARMERSVIRDCREASIPPRIALRSIRATLAVYTTIKPQKPYPLRQGD